MVTKREEPDGWVFDTIKAGTVVTKKSTTKRRKLSVIQPNNQSSPTGAEEALHRLDLKDSPLQMSSPLPGTVKRTAVRRQASATQVPSPSSKCSSQKRAPLQPDMNFGNSGSTVRLFRRVSDNSVVGAADISSVQRDENRPPMTETVSKESLMGRRAYNKVIDSAFQEVHAQTSNSVQRENLSRLADAWSSLDAVDPEGEYQLLKVIIEKVSQDAKLSALLLPAACAPKAPITSVASTPAGTPTGTTAAAEKQKQQQKLVLAQNNPHLKSHRRRQSTQATDDVFKEKAGDRGYEKMGYEKVMMNLPGQVVVGMEHTKLLADVLYGRWSAGLANRWGGV